jgi:hypothetical protein
VRKLAGLTAMILMAVLLAACGSDDGGKATEVATTAASVATEASTEAAAGTTEIATVDVTAEIATVFAAGESSPVATAVAGGMATPASAELPAEIGGTPMASPVAAGATPSTDAAIAPVPASAAVPDATPAATEVALTGRVELAGAANEAWVMTDEGCVGLGANAGLKPGRQLVVRDAEGVIVGVTTLAASDQRDACAWDFSLTVPESAFYAVSIPMTVEHIFTRQEVELQRGEIVVPIG